MKSTMNIKTEGQKTEEQKMLDNRSEQLNSTSDKYWQARGYDERPENWKELEVEPKKNN